MLHPIPAISQNNYSNPIDVQVSAYANLPYTSTYHNPANRSRLSFIAPIIFPPHFKFPALFPESRQDIHTQTFVLY